MIDFVWSIGCNALRLHGQRIYKGGVEGPAGPANAIPLSGPLFSHGHAHLICTCSIKQHSVNYTVDHYDNQRSYKTLLKLITLFVRIDLVLHACACSIIGLECVM